MMHMWMWFGYDLGEFMFSGLDINTRWAFALTWIALFIVALLFEASKVYLARVQREAQKRLYPFRSDERRNLLCERDQPSSVMEATTSRNTSSNQVTQSNSIKLKVAINAHQSAVFIVHNVVGYLLMLAVMVYNVHLLLAVVFGMMLGYFLFGTQLTRMQMQCFNPGRSIICTPECDDTAEGTTPPLLDASLSSESDLFICNTRTCIQPSHYFPTGQPVGATCHYGAKTCPSKLAKHKQLLSARSHYSEQSEKEDSPSVEDVQLLRTERQGCCKKKQEPPPESDKACCSSRVEAAVVVHQTKQSCCKKNNTPDAERNVPDVREESPQISCCHNVKSVTAESQEQIIQ